MEMNSLIERLHAEGCSCVIRKGTEIRLFHRRGVIDLFELYENEISTPALHVLHRAGIPTRFGQEVPYIINRKKDGRCPLETACDGLETPEEMLPAIRKFVDMLRTQPKK